ncbi:MAG: YkgJ family cysteine cluster protein [Planctomycetaceae bacterium]|nr:YkgJ family cysteine cluster protein [Planctomycetaceae bacterium]
MARPNLQLPVIQNWSCHNCGGCCREHEIEITAAEKKRIDSQKWSEADGIPSDRPVVESLGNQRFRLAHREDGACVFLDEHGLCRIHAKFGEAAKPLACVVYPYAFHPAGNRLAVSLRFSCPSVVRNLGSEVTSQQRSLQQLAEQVVAGKQSQVQPPAIHGTQQLDWSDFHKFCAAIDASLSDTRVGFATRLMRVLSWLELVEQSSFETVRGSRIDDYLQLLLTASEKAQPDDDLPVLQPSRLGRLMFRQLVAALVRHDTDETRRAGAGRRMGLLAEGLQFTFAIGKVPNVRIPHSVQTALSRQLLAGPDETDRQDTPSKAQHRIRFGALEAVFQGRTPEIDELLTRYFRIKVQGLHFCGVANFDLSLTQGFFSLALMYPATLWVARIRAARDMRSRISREDVEVALATIDHNFAYSPALGLTAARKRIQSLARMGQITRLCGWYSR